MKDSVLKEIHILQKLKSNFVCKFENVWTEDNYLISDNYNYVANIFSNFEVFKPNKELHYTFEWNYVQ